MTARARGRPRTLDAAVPPVAPVGFLAGPAQSPDSPCPGLDGRRAEKHVRQLRALRATAKYGIIPHMKVVDPLAVLKASRRYDLIFKYALAKAWVEGTPAEIREAEEAYLEMVRSRNGFYEGEPYRDRPDDFIDAFRKTAESIRTRGYDMTRPPIPVDGDDELLNGAHRLAACAAYGKKCPVEISDMWKAGGSVHKTFIKGHIHPAVRNWGVRKYFELLPGGRLEAEFGPVSNYPALPFPDWRARNRSAFVHKLKPAAMWAWCALTLLLRKGDKREKVRRRMLREKKKITGFAALADYWERRRIDG